MKNKMTPERIMFETLLNPNMKLNYEELQIPSWGKDLSPYEKQVLFGKGLGNIKNFSLTTETKEVFRRYYTMTPQERKEMWENMDTAEKEYFQQTNKSQEDFVAHLLGFVVSINCEFNKNTLSFASRFSFDENGKIKPGFIYDLLLTANPVEGAEKAFCLKIRHVFNVDELTALLRKLGWNDNQILRKYAKYSGQENYFLRVSALAMALPMCYSSEQKEGVIQINQGILNMRIKSIFESSMKVPEAFFEKCKEKEGKIPEDAFKGIRQGIFLAFIGNIFPQFETQFGSENTLEGFYALLKEYITPPKWWELWFFKKRDVAFISSPQKEAIQDMKTQSSIIEEKRTLQKKTMVEEEKQKSEEDFKDSTLRKLARQYADDEITKEEYERLKKILEE